MTTQRVQGVSHRVTIDDIATASGVSRQTVSNVVRQQGRVGEATRERVQHAIDVLGYRPHQGARNLRAMRTSQIAFVIAEGPRVMDANNSGDLLPHLANALSERGQRLLVLLDRAGHDDLLTLAGSGTVDGFVLSATPADPKPRSLASVAMPFVCLGQIEERLPQSWVDIDDSDGVETLVGYLINRGHRRIAFAGLDFVGTPGVAPAYGRRYALREHGFRAAMARAKMPVPQGYVVRETPGVRNGALDSLLGRPDRPTAVVGASDMVAAQVYAVARARGLSVGAGQDLAVTGFGGDAGALLAPALTSVAVPYALLAQMLVERVLQEIGGGGGCPGQMVRLALTVAESA